MATIADLRTARTGFNDVADILEGYGTRVSFTPSNLTPTAGTVTGGAKAGNYTLFGNLCYFQMTFIGYTQNTSTSTSYTASLPITASGNISNVGFHAYDANTGLMLTRCTTNSTTTFIMDRSGDWTATSGVNLYISGFYYVS